MVSEQIGVEQGDADRLDEKLWTSQGVVGGYLVPVWEAAVSGGYVPPDEPQLLLAGEVAPGWDLAFPIPVKLEQDLDGSYIVSEELFLVYGSGDTPAEAVDDYVCSLIEYYKLLSARLTNRAGRNLFERLRTYLQPIHR